MLRQRNGGEDRTYDMVDDPERYMSAGITISTDCQCLGKHLIFAAKLLHKAGSTTLSHFEEQGVSLYDDGSAPGAQRSAHTRLVFLQSQNVCKKADRFHVNSNRTVTEPSSLSFGRQHKAE